MERNLNWIAIEEIKKQVEYDSIEDAESAAPYEHSIPDYVEKETRRKTIHKDIAKKQKKKRIVLTKLKQIPIKDHDSVLVKDIDKLIKRGKIKGRLDKASNTLVILEEEALHYNTPKLIHRLNKPKAHASSKQKARDTRAKNGPELTLHYEATGFRSMEPQFKSVG